MRNSDIGDRKYAVLLSALVAGTLPIWVLVALSISGFPVFPSVMSVLVAALSGAISAGIVVYFVIQKLLSKGRS